MCLLLGVLLALACLASLDVHQAHDAFQHASERSMSIAGPHKGTCSRCPALSDSHVMSHVSSPACKESTFIANHCKIQASKAIRSNFTLL